MPPATVAELIARINALPPAERARVRQRIEQAIERPVVEAAATLRLLALEVAEAEVAEPLASGSEPRPLVTARAGLLRTAFRHAAV